MKQNILKDRAYAVNPNEYAIIKNFWIASYVQNDKVTYCNRLSVEHFPKEIKKLIGKASNFRIQAYD